MTDGLQETIEGTLHFLDCGYGVPLQAAEKIADAVRGWLLELSDTEYAAAAIAMLPFDDDEATDPPDVFEWHRCPECPNKGACPCSGIPWPAPIVRAALRAGWEAKLKGGTDGTGTVLRPGRQPDRPGHLV